MQQTVKRYVTDLAKGTTICGQNNKDCYTVLQKIKSCPIATTYLCLFKGEKVILNIGFQTEVFKAEIDCIRTLRKVRGNQHRPSLLDIDEWEGGDGNFYLFYVLQTVKGVPLATFFKQNRRHWLPLFIYQLLAQLEEIHQAGFVLGQITLDQLFVSTSNHIHLVHLNRIVRKGEDIQSSPNCYEQSYWTLGSRQAEPKKDLFSVVIVVLHIFFPEKFKRTLHPKAQLLQKIHDLPLSIHYRQCFLKAALGTYETAAQMQREFMLAIAQVEDIRYLMKQNFPTTPAESSIILLFAATFLFSAHLFF